MAYTCVNTSATNDSKLAGARYIMGFQVQSGSSIDGKKPNGFKFYLRTSATSGTLTCKLYDSSSTIPTALHSYANIDVSTITTSFTAVEFAGDAYGTALSAGQLIGLEYSSTSSVPDIECQVTNSDDSEGLFFNYDGSFETVTNRSPHYCYSATATPTGSSLLLPPTVAYI
jgi:hypothetical protein